MRFVMAGLVCMLAGAPLAAQDPAPATPSRAMPTALRDNRWALGFGVFGGGGFGVGYTNMTSARTAFTIDVDVDGYGFMGDIERNDTVLAERRGASVYASVAPGFRRYTAGRGAVASYFAGRLPIGINGQGYEDEDEEGLTSYGRWTPFVGAEAGWGLEWFPTDALSLRGEFVLGARYGYEYQFGADSSESRQHNLSVDIGGSGLSASLWF